MNSDYSTNNLHGSYYTFGFGARSAGPPELLPEIDDDLTAFQMKVYMQALLMMHPGLMWGFALADDVRYDGISAKKREDKMGYFRFYTDLPWLDGWWFCVGVTHY